MKEIDKLNVITQALRIARTCPPDWKARQLYLEMLKHKNKLSVQYLPDENNTIEYEVLNGPLQMDTYISCQLALTSKL